MSCRVFTQEQVYTMMNSYVNATVDSRLRGAYSHAYIGCMDLSDRLDRAMQLRGMHSQSGLARDSGVPQPTINRILKRKTTQPDHVTLRKLSEALDVDLEWLTDGVGRGPDSPKREGFGHVSDEARELIQCVVRLDRAGDAARKTFAYHAALLQFAEGVSKVQDSGVVRELREQELLLAPHSEPMGAKRNVSHKHKLR